MAAAPFWKVYDSDGNYQAATKDVETAAAIIGAMGGEGWTIRAKHRIVCWTEGKESFPAGESYDGVARTVRERFPRLTAAGVKQP